MLVSIEVPVVKGGWLIQCIESVFQQDSPNWVLSLLWDEGDALSHEILTRLNQVPHPKIQIFFGKNRGIARARSFLTENGRGELILPLDDDDLLEPHAVSRFIVEAARRPWAGIIRGRRSFIDNHGNAIKMQDWFPFGPRTYERGATKDLWNHGQPFAVRRKYYNQTSGWQGFPEFHYAGEDCDIFTKIEEVAEIVLIEDYLYRYRIHDSRTSLLVGNAKAQEMWRRIADRTIERRNLPVRRLNDDQPFAFSAFRDPSFDIKDVDVIIPFWETNERELPYPCSRTSSIGLTRQSPLSITAAHTVHCESPVRCFSRISLVCSSAMPISGTLSVSIFHRATDFSPVQTAYRDVDRERLDFDEISIPIEPFQTPTGTCERIEISFQPKDSAQFLMLHYRPSADGQNLPQLRLFEHCKGISQIGLKRCVKQFLDAGVEERSIHVIEKRQSAAANRNEGLRRGKKRFVCFSDDDLEMINPQTLKILADSLRELRCDVAGPRLLTPNGRLYSGVPASCERTGTMLVGGMGEADSEYHQVRKVVPWLPSTLLLTRRDVCLATGGFDENYAGSQHEDADFSLRVRSRGYRCCYDGSVAAVHHNELRNTCFSANQGYFFRRWSDRPDLVPESTR